MVYIGKRRNINAMLTAKTPEEPDRKIQRLNLSHTHLTKQQNFNKPSALLLAFSDLCRSSKSERAGPCR